MEEFRQSNRIIRQCIENLPEGLVLNPDAPGLDMLPGPIKKAAPAPAADNAPAPPPAGPAFTEIYSATEVPKGELGYYIVSDGTGKPYRMRIRTPSFMHISALPRFCEGNLVADVIALIGTIDIVLGECDR
jgi:NADH:ubiquinone oxidoreductase subunit D